MPPFWLVKTEPSSYSFADLQRDRRTRWDGIGNALALIHMRAMKEGDPVLVYHTGSEKAVVGLARVAKGPYPDPAAKDDKHVAVDLEVVGPAKRNVPVSAIRAEAACADLALVRIPRLSVMPVSDEAWHVLTRLAGL